MNLAIDSDVTTCCLPWGTQRCTTSGIVLRAKSRLYRNPAAQAIGSWPVAAVYRAKRTVGSGEAGRRFSRIAAKNRSQQRKVLIIRRDSRLFRPEALENYGGKMYPRATAKHAQCNPTQLTSQLTWLAMATRTQPSGNRGSLLSSCSNALQTLGTVSCGNRRRIRCGRLGL